MAINYLNSIDLNKNELLQGVIENQPNDAAAGTSPVTGQIYYNTTDLELRQYNGTAWVSVGDITSLTPGTNISIDNPASSSPTINLVDNPTLAGNLTITKNSPILEINDSLANDCQLQIKQSGSTTVLKSRGGTSSTGQFNFQTTNGSTTTNALFINQQARATFAGDVVITGGDITLGGTGRIQGVDTVTDNTDAANKLYVDNAIAGVPQGDITGIGAGDGLTGTDLSGPVPTLNVGAGTGITVNADDIAVTPAQTGITSIYNTGLVIGGASGVNEINFGASKIAFLANSTNIGNIYSGGFRPTTTNTFALGTSTEKWSSVYATTFLGDLNGTINTATTGVTQTAGDNTTKIATTAFVKAAVDAGAFTFGLGADTGTNQEVASGDVVDIAGSANISTAVSTVNSKPTVTVSLGDDVSIGGDFDAGGEGTFGDAVSIDGDLNMNSNQINDLLDPSTAQDAATKNYVDSSIVGNLVYQGGYNAATNTPDLDSSPSSSIKRGWTYTVTADGTFFTEQVRVGDVLIAESDAPTALTDWTTVQNNIDLADASTVGIGNVNQGGGINVSYSNGTATVSGEDSSATNKGIVIVGGGTGISVAYSNGTATVTNTQNNSDNTYAVTITDTATITHNLGTKDVIIQLYDTVTNETVYADVLRVNTSPYNTATITFASTPTNSIRVLVQKIG